MSKISLAESQQASFPNKIKAFRSFLFLILTITTLFLASLEGQLAGNWRVVVGKQEEKMILRNHWVPTKSNESCCLCGWKSLHTEKLANVVSLEWIRLFAFLSTPKGIRKSAGLNIKAVGLQDGNCRPSLEDSIYTLEMTLFQMSLTPHPHTPMATISVASLSDMGCLRYQAA